MTTEKMTEKFFTIHAPMTLAEIAALTGATLMGNGEKRITHLASLTDAASDSVVFLASGGAATEVIAHAEKYRALLKNLVAAACFVSAADAELLPENVARLVCADPRAAFIKLTNVFYQDKALSETGISKHACVDESAKIGQRVFIGAMAVIGPGVEIGDDSVILSGAVIHHAILGQRVRIGEGAKIGNAGFGWHSTDTGHEWVPQLGAVRIGNDVSVGANSCIDRGALSDTIIEDGVKIDNLVQIGHNCRIGKHSILAGMCGIAGSVDIGEWTLVGPGAGINGHLKIGSHVQIGAGAGLIQSLPDGAVVSGYPAQPARDFLRQAAMLRRMLKRG